MLVHELWRWGAPIDQIRALRPAVDAALAWLEGPGDPDGDGYVEYGSPGPGSLVNQGWKDSHDAVSFADGRLAEPPIAIAEVQAYTYAAWRAAVALAAADGDDATAAARNARADDLQARFEHDFWLPDREAFALALDRDKRPVDAIASNMGHCLWAGIVADRDKAAAVARWMVSPELFTGWGIRTLAASMGLPRAVGLRDATEDFRHPRDSHHSRSAQCSIGLRVPQRPDAIDLLLARRTALVETSDRLADG